MAVVSLFTRKVSPFTRVTHGVLSKLFMPSFVYHRRNAYDLSLFLFFFLSSCYDD